MTEKLIIALLSLLSIGSLAAVFVLWAKVQEEREKRWDEISRAATIEKEKGKEIEYLETEIDNLRWDIDCLNMTVDCQQDKLSDIICPTNNHVWRNGVCVKCGREQ